MAHRIVALSCLAALLLLAGGCSQPLQRPSAAFKSMNIADVSASGFTMNVDVDIHNPNAVALPLMSGDYGLSLGGTKIIEKAKIKPPATSIPANGAGTITVPIPVTYQNLLNVVDAIRTGGGNIKYGLSAALDFDSGMPLIGVQRVPFGYEGDLNVKELIKNNYVTILTSPTAKELAQKVLGSVFKF